MSTNSHLHFSEIIYRYLFGGNIYNHGKNKMQSQFLLKKQIVYFLHLVTYVIETSVY